MVMTAGTVTLYIPLSLNKQRQSPCPQAASPALLQRQRPQRHPKHHLKYRPQLQRNPAPQTPPTAPAPAPVWPSPGPVTKSPTPGPAAPAPQSAASLSAHSTANSKWAAQAAPSSKATTTTAPCTTTSASSPASLSP